MMRRAGEPWRSQRAHAPGQIKEPVTPPDTIFFYLPNERPYGIFCQWYDSPITIPTISLHFLSSAIDLTAEPLLSFNCTEQFFMFCKALYFADAASCTRIRSTPDPREQKRIGQTVKGFNDYKWARVKSRVALVGNWYKFCQNVQMRESLLGTGERELCEASPRDRVWGIGFNAQEAEKHRDDWGLNLLGKALMRVRARLKEELSVEAEGLKVDWEWDGSDGVQSPPAPHRAVLQLATTHYDHPDRIHEIDSIQQSSLLKLPAEIRLQILKIIFTEALVDTFDYPVLLVEETPWSDSKKPAVRSLFLINRLLHDEAEEALWKECPLVLHTCWQYPCHPRVSVLHRLSSHAYSVIASLVVTLHLGHQDDVEGLSWRYPKHSVFQFQKMANDLTGLKEIPFPIWVNADIHILSQDAADALARIVTMFVARTKVVMVEKHMRTLFPVLQAAMRNHGGHGEVIYAIVKPEYGTESGFSIRESGGRGDGDPRNWIQRRSLWSMAARYWLRDLVYGQWW